MRLKRLFLGVMLLVGITGAGAANAAPEDISASISLKAAVSGVLKRSSRTSQLSDVWKEGASFGERRLRRYQKPGM